MHGRVWSQSGGTAEEIRLIWISLKNSVTDSLLHISPFSSSQYRAGHLGFI